MTESKREYLLQLFQDQVDRGHDRRAAALFKLLSFTLPAAEIDRLHAEFFESPPRQREQAIRQLIKTRQIKHLVHFTQAANVRSIFDHGLLPRQMLHERWGNRPDLFKANDARRFDQHLNASCLSISFPNYRMFHRYRKSDPLRFWVVLLIKPEILWKLDCAFCVTNASAKHISSTPVEMLKPASALAALFDDFEDGYTSITRSVLHIPESFTTNPQAEVLVFGIIPAQAITAVCIERHDESYTLYSSLWEGIPMRIKPVYFGPRSDYAFWKK